MGPGGISVDEKKSKPLFTLFSFHSPRLTTLTIGHFLLFENLQKSSKPKFANDHRSRLDRYKEQKTTQYEATTLLLYIFSYPWLCFLIYFLFWSCLLGLNTYGAHTLHTHSSRTLFSQERERVCFFLLGGRDLFFKLLIGLVFFLVFFFFDLERMRMMVTVFFLMGSPPKRERERERLDRGFSFWPSFSGKRLLGTAELLYLLLPSHSPRTFSLSTQHRQLETFPMRDMSRTFFV